MTNSWSWYKKFKDNKYLEMKGIKVYGVFIKICSLEVDFDFTYLFWRKSLLTIFYFILKKAFLKTFPKAFGTDVSFKRFRSIKNWKVTLNLQHQTAPNHKFLNSWYETVGTMIKTKYKHQIPHKRFLKHVTPLELLPGIIPFVVVSKMKNWSSYIANELELKS
jgi:hypothetical protein